jgi:cytochrome P450
MTDKVPFAGRPQDFDFNVPEMFTDPYPAYAEMRSACPVARSEQMGWVLSRYDDVLTATKDHQVYRSDWGAKSPVSANLPRTSEPEGGGIRSYDGTQILPIEVDPPEHAGYRRILQSMFSARAVQDAWSAEAYRIADDLIDGFGDRDEVEFVSEYSMPMSGRMLAAAAGIDEADRGTFQDLTLDLHGNIGRVREFLSTAIAKATTGAFAVLHDATYEGRPLTEEEKLGYGVILVHAGWETTAAALSSIAFRLATQPELRDQLEANPALIPSAVEEFLRIDPPVHGLWRTAGSDTELSGCPIQRGDKVLLLWGSANRDGDAFPDPDAVKLDRSPNRHLSFGVGVHRCLGAYLARLEMVASLEQILRRLPRFELVQPPDMVNGPVRATHKLPVRFLRSAS